MAFISWLLMHHLYVSKNENEYARYIFSYKNLYALIKTSSVSFDFNK